ncbi:MAG: class I SAM-dependent DNA methyltransferase [Burkholderiales bacterium]|nr:class I SAM-dependent DNA methyltransferase [Burkholderiales bacterium]
MTPEQFIARWKNNALSERAGSQAHFLDLCALLGVPTPNDPENYCFERGATRTGAGHGWADVWLRNHFAWENKAPGRNLADALKQLMTYALALDNPPLLVVCDREIIQIHTHFTGTPSEVHTILLADIGAHDNLQKLRWLFTEPERFKPRRTVRDVTAEAAGRFARVAQALTGRGHDPQQVAHFLIQCLFSMFAEDAKLLPEKLFERVIEKSTGTPEKLAARLGELFASMRAGGEFLLEDIAWFNGGLFETTQPLPLQADEVATLLDAAKMDWSHIEPSIFGTLFERGLDPALRSQLGANYTDPATIAKLIEPVIVRPLVAEWDAAKATIAAAMTKYHAGGKGSQTAYATAQATFLRYIERLKAFRVLDPACGSGNFLYLSLRALKDLEHRANLDAEALGLHRQLTIETSPANVLGLEINPYAAELARVTVWIGEIQWMLKHGYDIRRNPILSTLDHVECRDALIKVGADGTAEDADWPACDAIVGNPPFLGDKKMRAELGAEYVAMLRVRYDGRVPGGADFVTYWLEKARAQIEAGKAQRAGLVATNSIRGGANRKVLDRICATTRIFEAWSDEDWINEGAAVRVSLVCFGNQPTHQLNGKRVDAIFADLSASEGHGADAAADLTQAQALTENSEAAFSGIQKTGPFEIPGELARSWLALPNPNGRGNTEVVRPWNNGLDITRRNRDMWIVDFGVSMPENAAALFEAPFEYVKEHVKPTRVGKREARTNEMWWIFQWSRPKMRAAISGRPRFIVTPEVSKHRVFAWMPAGVVADKNLVVVARSDDATFGILHSRFHELWSLRLGTSLEDRPRYTPTTTFETFPFPDGLTPRDTAQAAPAGPHADAIASAAQRLNELRENWLNPPEWVDRIPEIVPGYPDRIVAKPGHEAELKKRTLTNLYNARPAWLDSAHQALDAAVAAAYGWPDYTPAMPDAEILKRLLALNLSRKAAEGS